MPGTTYEEWMYDDEHHCGDCLTELEGVAASCYRCGASFHGPQRAHLVPGRPDLARVLCGG